MKKRILSIMLTLCMVLAVTPITSLADTQLPWEAEPSNWTSLTDGVTEINGGTSGAKYYLSENITLNTTLTVKGGTSENPVVLDLNGHVLKLNSEFYGGTATGSVIYVIPDSNGDTYFTLQDSSPKAKHYFSKQANGLWKWDPNVNEPTEGCELVEGGVITGGTGTDLYSNSDTYGGGILVFSESEDYSCHVTVNGVSIVGCQASHGGGICNRDGSNTLSVNGSSIKGCTASYGGGIYSYYGTLSVNENTKIEGCTATEGGGVYNGSGTNFTMNGGSIEGCTATEGGGVLSNSRFKMTGGIIKDCTATTVAYSAALLLANGSMYADGGIIDGTVYASHGSILHNSDAEGTTVFNAKVKYDHLISAGIFYGGLDIYGGHGQISGHTYTVQFYINSTATEPYKTAFIVGDGTKFIPPAVPEKIGHTLSWYSEPTCENELTSDTVIASDINVYAQWSPSSYTVTLNTGGGTINSGNINEYTYGVGAVLPTANDMSYAGHSFEGWYDNKAFTGSPVTEIGTDETNNKEYWAKWTAVATASGGGSFGNSVPIISGIVNGETYCEPQTVTVTGRYDVTVSVNGKAVTLTDGKFVLSPAEGTQTIIATDRAGNVSAEMIVIVNDGHEGGTAGCTERAVCKHCGLEYGELDSSNHTSVTHIKAKKATREAEGNIEYWYCEDCDRYFNDKDCKNEIVLADTVIAKPVKNDDENKVPKTADNSRMALWLAFLFVSGGLLSAAGIYGKTQKSSAK